MSLSYYILCSRPKPSMRNMFVFPIFFMSIQMFHGYEEESVPINITLIQDPGAVCLDGSPGAYFYDKGFEDGANNLIVYLEGGGWCVDEGDCTRRSNTTVVSPFPIGIGSNKNRTSMNFQTILSPFQSINPDFYNWNRVFVSYCDGASFMSDMEATKANLYLRGARILWATIEEVIRKGNIDVNDAILMGESAGGLAAMLNCDRFRAFLPSARSVKCISDSAFFIDTGYNVRRFIGTNAFHELASVLPPSCTRRMNSSLCLLPQNFIGDIETPLFILNSNFDSYQIQFLDPPPGDKLHWKNCVDFLPNCTAYEFQAIKDFRAAFLEKLNGVADNPSRGIYINTCYLHDFINRGRKFWSTSYLTIHNKTIASAIGDWFYDRKTFGPIRLINETDSPAIC